jgi:hypothetical protein
VDLTEDESAMVGDRASSELGRYFRARDFVPVAQAHIMADTESLGEAGIA